jgi:dephospho-CoA kinase|tara:strand:+ start:2990 stop:3625 length:636 start_codon:yes stop_codon:yes gene_type:complete
VRVIGLTGGIGSGKSTVSERLVAKGAVLIDADAIVKEMQQPGELVYLDIVSRFGDEVVDADGSLLRPAIANIVFNDKDALKDLNQLVHPPVNKEIRRRIRNEADTDNLVVLDIPLLIEGLLEGGPPRYVVSGILVVDTPVDVAAQRLVTYRGFSEDDARARMKSQVPREKRLELADFVVRNDGEPSLLDEQIPKVLSWVSQLKETLATPEP